MGTDYYYYSYLKMSREYIHGVIIVLNVFFLIELHFVLNDVTRAIPHVCTDVL